MTILASLNRAYDRLAQKQQVPSFGFSSEKIGYCLLLNPDGSICDLIDLRDSKKNSRILPVPASPKRSGSTPRPNFLWDNANYALGIGKLRDPSDMRYDSFRSKHLEYLAQSSTAELQAFYSFLSRWEPENCKNYFETAKPPTEGIVFALSSSYRSMFLHETEEARKIWAIERDRWIAIPGKSTERATCLVSGELSPIQRTHPPIKGVWGGKVEMAIVSFNRDVFASYGHEQGDNAPVSEAAAFGYTTALNKFLEKDSGHRIQIGDASVVFWAEASDPAHAEEAEALFPAFLTEVDEAAEARMLIRPILEKMRQGQPLSVIRPQLSEGVRFYVLGLAPNAARLSIRFWLEDDFGKLAENYQSYLKDMAIEPWPKDRPKPSIGRCVLRTAPARRDRNNQISFDKEKISPLLAGELLRAILTGASFPSSLLAHLLMRIRSDQVLDSVRIALIKALLVRNMRLSGHLPEPIDGRPKEEYLMRLQPDDPNPARRLGRLFAIIEKAQLAALGSEINATVKDKFLSAASITPQQVFTGILANSQNHLKRLRNGHSDADWIKDAAQARRVGAALDRDIGKLVATFEDGFPKQHSNEEQALFFVGYYQERFGSKETKQSNGDTTEIETNETIMDEE